ncbi:MAG: HAMP domain-containing sensor histidine kinase [Acidobacteriaceae bacterium]|jgi:signal transduction histidine kinase
MKQFSNPPDTTLSIADELSALPVSAAHGSHTAHFYSSDSLLVSDIVQCLGATLAAGGAAVVIATPAHRAAFEEQLLSRGLDLAQIAQQGRWLSLDAAETLAEFMVEGWPDASRFAAHIGGLVDRLTSAVSATSASEEPQIAAYGEMVSVLWEEGKTEASIRLEELWNQLAQTRCFHLSCGWPLHFFARDTDGVSIQKICSEHDPVAPGQSYDAMSEDERRRYAVVWQLRAQALEEETHQLEAALRTTERLASIGRLAATVAHEINNPLEAVTNLIYLARQNADLPEPVRSCLVLADEELQRVSHIARQTLGFYRDSASPVSIAVPEAIDDMLAVYHRRVCRKQISLRKSIHTSLRLLTLPGEFNQMVSNLISNAIDASPQGGAIELRAWPSVHPATGAPGIHVVVADRGPGIPEPIRLKIFTPFFTTKKDLGTGLGLWIVKGLVLKAGGFIRCRSRVATPEAAGSGTVMMIFLPSESDPAAREQAA